MKTHYASINLNGLELSVKLGWPQDERLKEQIIRLDIVIHFLTPPKACQSDDLNDTHCYDALIEIIKRFVAARKFRLLEHLGCEIYTVIKNELSDNAEVCVKITKKPAILNLTDGVTFCYGDFA